MWSDSDQQHYSEFMADFVKNYDKPVDCADLAIIGLVEFAAQSSLPVRLFDFDERPRRWFDYAPGETDKDQYIARTREELGAVNLIDNTVPIHVADLRGGDLILSELPQEDSTGHTRIVTQATFDSGIDDWVIDWYQGTLPPARPSPRHFPFRQMPNPHNVRLQPRRWNFAQFG
jgi:hypothetical protein